MKLDLMSSQRQCCPQFVSNKIKIKNTGKTATHHTKSTTSCNTGNEKLSRQTCVIRQHIGRRNLGKYSTISPPPSPQPAGRSPGCGGRAAASCRGHTRSTDRGHTSYADHAPADNRAVPEVRRPRGTRLRTTRLRPTAPLSYISPALQVKRPTSTERSILCTAHSRSIHTRPSVQNCRCRPEQDYTDAKAVQSRP